MSKSKQSIVCLVILLAMPLMALAQRGGKSAAPTLSSISPASATAGGAGFSLTVSGTNFTLGSVVQWNGGSLTTTFVSASQLQASIPSALVSVAGAAQITVFTSGRGGGTSSGVAFTINPAATTTTTTTATMLAITTTSVSAGTVGTSYSATLAASGGTAPYTWSISSGALPPGLALSTAGAISGTPTTSGTYSFTPQVADSASHTATNTYSLVVSTGPLAIATTSVPAGTAGTAYSTAMAASGGTPPHGWSVSGGALPPGLSMSSSGAISGTPSASGSYSFTARVADAASGTASYTYSLAVAAPTTTPTGPVFMTGFEAGNPAWDFVWNSTDVTITSAPPPGRSGNAAQIHYHICGDSTNTACGAAHQDSNRWISKIISPGLTHFFVRGYVYFKTPEADATPGVGIQRKMLRFGDTPSAGAINGTGYTYEDLLIGWGSSGGVVTSTINLSLVEAGNSACNANPVQKIRWDLAPLTYDAWHAVEIEVQLNTPGVVDGVFTLYVDGIQKYHATDVNYRGTCSTPVKGFFLGNQADRGNYNVVDEYRYWDDIVISTSHIGP